MTEHEEQYERFTERVFRPQEEQEKQHRQPVVETRPAASVYRFYGRADPRKFVVL